MAAAEPMLVRSWSDLPMRLLSEIFQKLTDCVDISHCAAVCLSWQSLLRTLYRQLVCLQSPFLLLSSSSHCSSCALFNAQTNKLHQLFLPQLKESWCSSSHDGWLLIIPFRREKNLCLLNPFTRDRVELPPHLVESSSGKAKDLRVVTSTNPLDPECVVLAIDEQKLYSCRPGDKSWTKVVTNYKGVCNHSWGDTVCYKGEFYAEYGCLIFHIKVNGSGGVVEAVDLPVPYVVYDFNSYLVELKGELVLVQITIENRFRKDYSLSGVRVYRLDWHRKQWIKVKNIGSNNTALLLGKHGSTSLCVTDFTGFLKANCIYFITIHQEMVVYDLDTGRHEILHQFSSTWTLTPPNWLRVESAEIMASKHDQIDYVAPWPIIEEHFVKVLHKIAKNGLLTSTWEEMAWGAISDNMFEEFGKRYTISALKSKYDHLCRLHHEFSKLLAHTGMVWDPKTNKVRADEDVWESYIKKDPFGKRFKNKGFEYFHPFDEIIAHTHQPSQSYETKIDLKIRGVSDAAEVCFDIKGGVESIFDNKRHCSLNNLKDILAQQRKQRQFDYESSINSTSKTSSEANEEFRKQEHHALVFEDASIEECIKILEAMDDLDEDVYIKGCQKLISVDWRRMFVAISDATKREWLYSLI
ncbi:hypothetical protein WN944_002264 [Citrus x changshan-huyou]|uniref:F-box domain-containing protein n=1 Tax=Citrus x changshan-huyou TaxID=2935761 RepID=A0AAP0MGA8_9ROSI